VVGSQIEEEPFSLLDTGGFQPCPRRLGAVEGISGNPYAFAGP